MSKSNSWLFSGTSGTNSKISKTVLPKNTLYKPTAVLYEHIEYAQPTKSGKEGIKGAHNKDNFIKEVNRVGAKIIGTVPNSQMEGVEKISYKMPMKDAKGNLTGEFKSKTQKYQLNNTLSKGYKQRIMGQWHCQRENLAANGRARITKA